MELTPRLRAIASQVPHGARFADIGTDHAYLPVWLLLQGTLDRAIAADLRAGPLGRAKKTAAQYGVAGRISFRLCDGLSGIQPEEADVIAIAGMGGDTIISILASAFWVRREGKTLLLQPMTAHPELRRWLRGQGYAIAGEQIAREGNRLYSIWTVRGGEMPDYSPGELWAGRQSSDPLRGEYLSYVLRKVRRVLDGHRAAAQPDRTAIARLETVECELEEMKGEWANANTI